jgi:V/A-type H+-transporting ATPase subunit I
VSYIRLFAVGMATYAVASAFNLMSMEIGFSSIITDIEAVLVLLFGHTLNIALAGMGVLVHGIRLNVLEFSTHLGMEWTGTKYDPFECKARVVSREEADQSYNGNINQAVQ